MHAIPRLLASADAPVPKDVVIATMGASAALGAVVLVFLGLLIAAVQELGADSVRSVREKRKRAVWPAAVLFCLCAGSEALGFWWLERGGGNALYAINNVVFVAELGGIVGVSIFTARKTLG
jgi:hypothetical protein